MATPLLLMSSSNDRNPSQPEPKPDLNPPKPRGRKSKSQNGAQKKQPQRGMGVAQLERLLRQQQNPHHDQHQKPPPPPPHHQGINPLSGAPVHQPAGFPHYGFPVHRGPCGEMRPGIRVLEGSTELPSMPNMEPQEYLLDHSTTASLSFKKKRVIGDEIGFMREKDKYADQSQIILPSNAYNFPGFDHHALSSGGFSGYNNLAGSEVVAIHKKGNGSGNVMMEYGFFPKIRAEENEGWKLNNGGGCCIISHNNNNYHEMTDLKLKMGCSDSCSSPSPSSSSLSSLTTATTNYSATNTCSLDLSLKLSY